MGSVSTLAAGFLSHGMPLLSTSTTYFKREFHTPCFPICCFFPVILLGSTKNVLLGKKKERIFPPIKKIELLFSSCSYQNHLKKQ